MQSASSTRHTKLAPKVGNLVIHRQLGQNDGALKGAELLDAGQVEPLLRIHGLTVRYRAEDGTEIPALHQVSLDLRPAEIVGLLGESGCGKTTLALAVLRLLPPAGSIVGGSVLLRGRDLTTLDEPELEKIRGAEISMIFQEPGISLNPVIKAGDQVAEVIRLHQGRSGRQSREEAKNVLQHVRLTDTDRIFAAYPHELSGGQRQRILIALAIACRPPLVIADEPTAGLDSIAQAEILDLLKDLRERFGLALLLISHNPAVLASITDRILVMYATRIVEEGATGEMLKTPWHPYTQALLRCIPHSSRGDSVKAERLLLSIPGSAPAPSSPACGCPFEPRCPEKMEVCGKEEPGEWKFEARRVYCFKYGN